MVPFWARLRHVQWFKSALNGVNATAIDLDGAACVILSEGAVVTAADAMVFILAGTLAQIPWFIIGVLSLWCWSVVFLERFCMKMLLALDRLNGVLWPRKVACNFCTVCHCEQLFQLILNIYLFLLRLRLLVKSRVELALFAMRIYTY